VAGLWNKFLVRRRDGSIPEWPWLVMGARDPAAPAAIRFYANACFQLQMDPEYVSDLYKLADEWDAYRHEHGNGDPDAAVHRTDDPDIAALLDGVNATVNHRKKIITHRTDGVPCECHPRVENYG
jgi:hypothetical protein